MDVMLTGLTWKCCLVYIDDILIFSSTMEQHVKDLRMVFDRLRESKFSIKLEKCHFAQQEIIYLGHLISAEGIKPHPGKVDAICKFKPPTTLTELRSFLGIVNYYHRFVPNLGTIASPLYELMKKNVRYEWTEGCQSAFEEIKMILIQNPILRFPNFEKEFFLHCDASNVGIGVILCQLDDEKNEYVVAYASRTLSQEERNYTTTERECLAVLFGIKQFKPYIYGKHFTVYTDHGSLQWLLKLKDSNGRLCRWALQLQGMNITIKHRSGKANGNADALSRSPLPIQVVTTRARNKNATPNTVVVNARKGGTARAKKRSQQANSEASSSNQEMKLPSDTEIRERIRVAQRADEEWSPLIEYLESKTLPSDSSQATKIKVRSSSFTLEDELLYHIWIPTNSNRNTEVRKQLVVPNCDRQNVMKEMHGSYHGGHFGTTKTFDKIRDRYWWQSMYKDIEEYCKACLICQYRNVPRRQLESALMSTPIADGPFERLGIDIVGPLPETRNGNKYIVVITDSFTRWCEAFVTAEVKEEWIAEILVCEVICRYGAPKYLVSDRGANFLSALCYKIYELLHIKKVNTTAYHPQANGIVERFNGVLVDMLAKFANEDDWDTYIPYVLAAYRSSYNSTTNETPYRLVFGRNMILPLDAMMNKGDAFLTNRSDYADEIAFKIQESNRRVKETLAQIAATRDANNLNMNNPKEFNVGEEVLLKAEVRAGTNRKLNKNNWKGPYKILERLSLVNYKLDIPGPGPKPHAIVHVDRLKKYYNPHSTSAFAASTIAPTA
jgi:hypothetical protein